MGHCGHEGMDMFSNKAQLVLRDPKYPPDHHTTTSSLNHWERAGWSHVHIYYKHWPYQLNVMAEVETHWTRSFDKVNLGFFVLADIPHVVLFCCSSSPPSWYVEMLKWNSFSRPFYVNPWDGPWVRIISNISAHPSTLSCHVIGWLDICVEQGCLIKSNQLHHAETNQSPEQ